MIIPITDRARRYGYVIWSTRVEAEVRDLLKESEQVRLFFNGADHGTKRVDWRYHRISVGQRWTRMIPEEKGYYKMTFQDGTLYVECQ